LLSDWGRAAKRFATLEDALRYLSEKLRRRREDPARQRVSRAGVRLRQCRD